MSLLVNLNNLLWLFITFLLIIVGLYFTFKLKFLQFNIKLIFKNIINKDNNKGFSSFKTLMLSLAGRIGVGSISGVALAIYLGGPGTIFWIWIISFISAIIGYVESYLGVKYSELHMDNIYLGGPSFYLRNGLNKYKLAIIYSVMIIVCYCGGFMLIQSNTITKAMTTIYSDANPMIIGLILCFFTYIIIFGGIDKVAKTTSKIVPIMSLGYIGIAIFVIFKNFSIIPDIFLTIIEKAFSYKSFFTGFFMTMLIGFQRGIFSNEGGIGTGSMAAGSSGSDDCVTQGIVQMIGIYITSFFICTSTAIIVLTSDYKFINIIDPNGIELAINAFYYHLNNLGNIFLILAIFLFAFSTILSGYFYGENSLKFLFKYSWKKYINVFKIFTCLILFLGTIISSEFLWVLVDTFVSLLAFINLYAIINLRNEIKK